MLSFVSHACHPERRASSQGERAQAEGPLPTYHFCGSALSDPRSQSRPQPRSGDLKIAQDEVSALQTHERESWVTVPSLFMSSLFPALSLRGPSPPMNLLVISQTAVIDSALCQVGFGRPKNPTSDERPTQLNLCGCPRIFPELLPLKLGESTTLDRSHCNGLIRWASTLQSLMGLRIQRSRFQDRVPPQRTRSTTLEM